MGRKLSQTHINMKLVTSLLAQITTAKRFPDGWCRQELSMVPIRNSHVINCLHVRCLSQMLNGRNKALSPWI